MTETCQSALAAAAYALSLYAYFICTHAYTGKGSRRLVLVMLFAPAQVRTLLGLE